MRQAAAARGCGRVGPTNFRPTVPHMFRNGPLTAPPLGAATGLRVHPLTHAHNVGRHVGKTEFAIAHFEFPLVVRRRDDLKRFRGATDGIVFDDVDFRDWTPEDTIGLLSMDKPRSLPARFHDAFIEADIPLIFTTNKKPKKMFACDASLLRSLIICITELLFGNSVCKSSFLFFLKLD